jgi:hypothetical protein
VSTPEAINHLVTRIVLPPDLREHGKDGITVLNDKFVIFQSVAILFPMAIRALVKPKYDEGKLTLDDVCRLLMLPPRYVLLVLSEVWDEVYPMIISR